MIRRLTSALLACGLLAGCGGGGSSSVPHSQATTASPQSVKVTITIPTASTSASRLRRPKYVSTNTQSVSVAVNGGTPVVASVSAGSANCQATTTGRTCTVLVAAPAGQDTFTEITYASANGTGSPLSQNTTSATIVAGQANTVSLTLDGIVASIVLALGNASPPVGTPATIPLTVTLNDASGAGIIGSDPFVNPVTLTDSDTSGATKLSATTLNSPADASNLTVAYNGAALASATFSASATGVASSAVTPATLTPGSASSTAFVDWPTYGYDIQRSDFNPNTAGITPASIANLHVAWQHVLNSASQTQPLILTGVAGHTALVVVGTFANLAAYDAYSGALVWTSATLPTQDVQGCGQSVVAGTPVYDKSLGALFVAAGSGGSAPNHVVLYELSASTGATMGHVDLTPNLLSGEASSGHTSVLEVNGTLYVGTGSDCEGPETYPNWRGRLVAVNAASMTVSNTFYTTWNQGGAYGGGGVWAWGGASSDGNGNIYVAGGNAETAAAISPDVVSAPFTVAPQENVGYAERLAQISSDLTTVKGSDAPAFNFSTGQLDLDYAGTPVVYSPSAISNCGTLVATQSKGGLLVLNSTATMNELATFALSIPSGTAYYMGNPGYSPNTSYLYAPITSSGGGTLGYLPGMVAVNGCGPPAIQWKAAFGPDSSTLNGEFPRSAPTATAGGVVFMGAPCQPGASYGCGTGTAVHGALWALDASAGTILNGGDPVLITGDNMRMAPSADGLWIYVLDGSGNLVAMTVDPSVAGVTAKANGHVVHPFRHLER